MSQIQNLIPLEIWSKGVSLEECIGIKEWGWNFKYIMKIIDILTSENNIILGGDVYQISNSTIKATYDNWYFDSQDSAEAIVESASKAKKYILMYHEKYGDNYIYTLVHRE